MTVRTRFAPSPTGYLHIGGVRTALFNWLFARQKGGKFVLRIDDTDQQRNVQAALQPILDGFKWLGLDWDEGPEVGGPHGPYFQSQKLDRYRAVVAELVVKGAAYWDYQTREEAAAEKKAAEKEKRQNIYDRRWMAETEADRRRFEGMGRAGAVKLKMPREGFCRFRDQIRGDVEVPWVGEQDIVIQRSDGWVTYNLANVVDDFDMKITHVIRAAEHLSNTPRQLFMIDALGWPRPEYAHVPYVAEPGSESKLSKRKIAQYLKNPDFKKVYDHAKAIADRIGVCTAPEVFNPVLVAFYEQVGYLPNAIINYLFLLGWAHADGKSEFFTRQEMIELFAWNSKQGSVSRAPASFDAKKLMAFQERYMQQLPAAEKVGRALPFLVRAGLVADAAAARPTAARVVEAAGPRLRVAGDVLDYDYFFLADDLVGFDPAVAEKQLRDAFKGSDRSPPPLREALSRLRGLVAEAEPFDAATVKQKTEELARAEGCKPGPLSNVLRVAVTGKEVGFSAYDTFAIIGRERCLARIDRALNSCKPGA